MAATFNVDKLFVSKILQDGEIAEEVADVPFSFVSPEGKYREGYQYIREYHAEHGKVPTIRVFSNDNPEVSLVRVDEPMSDIVKRLTDQYRQGIIDDGLNNLFLEGGARLDADSATNLLAQLVANLHTAVPTTTDEDVTQTGSDRLARYQERRDNPNTLVGITTGFPSLDRATQGLQPGQLVTVTGLTKASKSTLALLMAMAGQEAGETIAYFTYEMTVEEQGRRLDAYRAGINDNLLNSGKLNDEQWAKVTKGVHLTENLVPLVFSENTMTVSAVAAKIDIIKPTVVIIDGVYMMDDEHGESKGSPQALANIVAGLKFLAMRRKICIIAVTQSTPARTKGETLNGDSIMGSRAFTQYSNVVIGLERVEDHTDMRKLRILMSRSCAPCDAMLKFDYDTGTFEEIEDFELSEEDEELKELMDDTRYSTTY